MKFAQQNDIWKHASPVHNCMVVTLSVNVQINPGNACSCLQDSKEMTDGSIFVREENDRVLAHVLIIEAKHEWEADGGSNPQVQALACYAKTAVRGLNRPGVCDTVLPALLLEAFSNGLR